LRWRPRFVWPLSRNFGLRKKKTQTKPASFSSRFQRSKDFQALNRLTFGPGPDDARQVKTMGSRKWLDLQLHPERIPENPVPHPAS